MASRTYTTRSRTENVRNHSSGETLRNNEQNQQAERIHRSEGFTVIAPNEKKRQELHKAIENDEKKLQQYEERKQQSLPRCNYVGTLGGSSATNAGVTSSCLISNSIQNKRFQGTKQDYRAQGRRQENVQIAKMKEHQRQMTKRNEEREKERKEKLDVDRKLKMENFLAGLEKKTSQSPGYDSNEKI